MISEEHDTSSLDSSTIAAANTRDTDIERQVVTDNVIFMKDVQVWIDPLDATKEYTGDIIELVYSEMGSNALHVTALCVTVLCSGAA